MKARFVVVRLKQGVEVLPVKAGSAAEACAKMKAERGDLVIELKMAEDFNLGGTNKAAVAIEEAFRCLKTIHRPKGDCNCIQQIF